MSCSPVLYSDSSFVSWDFISFSRVWLELIEKELKAQTKKDHVSDHKRTAVLVNSVQALTMVEGEPVSQPKILILRLIFFTFIKFRRVLTCWSSVMSVSLTASRVCSLSVSHHKTSFFSSRNLFQWRWVLASFFFHSSAQVHTAAQRSLNTYFNPKWVHLISRPTILLQRTHCLKETELAIKEQDVCHMWWA